MSKQKVEETQRVWDKHIEAWDARNLDAIMEDYTEESVMILNNSKLKGTEAISNVFANLFQLFDAGDNQIDPAVIEGEVVYITWNFKHKAENGNSYFGTDTLVVQYEKINYQTIASELYEKYPVTGLD